jgi:hypothetical protein
LLFIVEQKLLLALKMSAALLAFLCPCFAVHPLSGNDGSGIGAAADTL